MQAACVRWCRLAHPSVLIFAIPNGGARDVVTGAVLKAEGVVAGVPDLFLASRQCGRGGLWIEMKTETGRVSEAQKDIHGRLVAAGYAVEVCRTFDGFRRAVDAYLAGGE